MAEVSTVPAYILANEHLLMWLLKHPFNEEFNFENRSLLQEFVHLDFHRWNSTRPDHVFQHRWEKFEYDYVRQGDRALRYEWEYAPTEVVSAKPSIVLAALQCLVDEYLIVRNNELYVKTVKFGWWQNMLSRISPLPVLAWAYLKLDAKYAQPTPPVERTFKQLYPYDEGVENYITQHGLNDSHVHANLCAYAEECWLHALDHVTEEWRRQRENYHDDKEVPRLYRFIHVDLSPELMEEHMEVAKYLRVILVHYASGKKIPWGDSEGGDMIFVEPEGALAALCKIPPQSWGKTKSRRVFEAFEYGFHGEKILPDTTRELQWMMEVLRRQKLFPRDLIDRALLLYILLLNEFYMLCVQRDNFVGFRQFQRYSSVQKLLVTQPYYFSAIFERFHGKNRDSVTNYVELRISPQKEYWELSRQCVAILLGYLNYVHNHLGMQGESINGNSYSGRICGGDQNDKNADFKYSDQLGKVLTSIDECLRLSHQRLVRPTIVIHLIKQSWEPKDNSKLPEEQVRYDQGRRDYEERLENLRRLLNDIPALRKWVCGIDAAAYELDTPPDVFAPAYRKARYELNLPHATYHAGEDFYHLVSGIRAVYESIDFLELRSGDRIGHATALGVNPALWLNSMPGQIAPTRGEWLLDLLFAWNMLQNQKDMDPIVNRLNYDIREHGYAVFRESNPSPHFLKRVFDLRCLDPLLLRDMYEKALWRIKGSRVGDSQHVEKIDKSQLTKEIIRRILSSTRNVDPHRIEEIRICQALCREAPKVIELLINWQCDRKTWDRSQEHIEVPTDYFPASVLTLMQQLVTRKLVEQSIVVETLPTSNLRIGQYKEMGQHHSLRWLGASPCDGDTAPLVVLGTDDPGTFATDIKGEFYHLFTSLLKCGYNAQEALDTLIHVNQCGEHYAFRSLSGNPVE